MTDLTFKAPQAVASTKSAWQTLDISSLPPEMLKLHDEYKAQAKLANEAKKAFEYAMRAAVVAPTGKTLFFGYLYGKLSYAFLDDKPAKSKASVVNFSALARR